MKILAVANQKGGVGKSTLTVHLAYAALEAGLRVLLVDMDKQGSLSLTFPANHHYDFRTPEYARFDTVQDKKWESTRGVGHSFGANRNERPEDIVTATELVRSFVDIVAKNGNLLIGIGPDEFGRFPAEQLVPLRGLGEWLRVNGEAVYRTRPWRTAQTTTTAGTGVRFTAGDGCVYAILLDASEREFGIRGFDATGVQDVRMLGLDEPLGYGIADGILVLRLPERLPVSPAHVLRLGLRLGPGTRRSAWPRLTSLRSPDLSTRGSPER